MAHHNHMITVHLRCGGRIDVHGYFDLADLVANERALLGAFNDSINAYNKALEPPPAGNAVDPHAGSTGTPTTCAASSSLSDPPPPTQE